MLSGKHPYCTPKVYFSKVYFCEMYPTCVSSKLCELIILSLDDICELWDLKRQIGVFSGLYLDIGHVRALIAATVHMPDNPSFLFLDLFLQIWQLSWSPLGPSTEFGTFWQHPIKVQPCSSSGKASMRCIFGVHEIVYWKSLGYYINNAVLPAS